MTYDQVETFLAAVSNGTISAAAQALYVSQSTVSSRIQLLEQELGIPLLLRQKGHRTIELTSYGREFVPIANQWASLWKDTQSLKQKADLQTLRIGAVDAINNYTMLPLYRQHIERYPNLRLSIHTFHSTEINSRVQSRDLDLGIVFSRRIRYPDVVSKTIYRELMYLVCQKDSPYGEGIRPQELSVSREVFLRWDQGYQQWHDRYWDPAVPPLVTVNTGSMLRHYLTEPGRWAIAPMSVVQRISRSGDLVWYRLAESPPPRMGYLLRSRYPRASRQNAIELFVRELEQYIQDSPSICTFEDWMLEDRNAGSGCPREGGQIG